jgi:phage terminase small subunit
MTVPKKRAKKKGKKKPPKPRSKQPGKRNPYAHIPNAEQAKDTTKRKPNGFQITDKQALFVEYYIGKSNLNATDAATRAGYSKTSAASQGHQLLKNPRVQKYLRTRMANRVARLEVDQNRVIQELAVIGFSRLNDFASWRGTTLTITDSSEIPEHAQGALQSIAPVVGKKGVLGLKIRLHDKVAALKLLAQHLGMLEVKAGNASKGRIVDFMERLHAEAGKESEK